MTPELKDALDRYRRWKAKPGFSFALLSELRPSEASAVLAEAYLAEHPADDEVHTLAEKPLAWTKEPPTVPGWYWWKGKDGSEVAIRCWEIVQRDDGLFVRTYTYAPTPEQAGGEWAGPLTPPGS